MNQARGFSGGSGANAEALLIFGGSAVIRLVKDNHFNKGPKCNNRYN